MCGCVSSSHVGTEPMRHSDKAKGVGVTIESACTAAVHAVRQVQAVGRL